GGCATGSPSGISSADRRSCSAPPTARWDARRTCNDSPRGSTCSTTPVSPRSVEADSATAGRLRASRMVDPRHGTPARSARSDHSCRRSRPNPAPPGLASALRAGTMAPVTHVVILGGGPGGYESALVAAQLGAEVTVVDSGGIGGSAVITDCVPSKTLIATAELMTEVEGASELG